MDHLTLPAGTGDATASSRPAVRLLRVPWLIPFWAQAQVWGRWILIRRGVPLTLGFLAHELAHVRQWQRLGVPRFIWYYLSGLIRSGYRRHPLELQAQAAESDPVYLAWAGEVLAERNRSKKNGRA